MGTILYLQKLPCGYTQIEGRCRFLLLLTGDWTFCDRQLRPASFLFLQASRSLALHNFRDCFYRSVLCGHFAESLGWRHLRVLRKLLQHSRWNHSHSVIRTPLCKVELLNDAKDSPIGEDIESNFLFTQLFRIARLLAKYDIFRKGILHSTYGRKIKILFTQLYVATLVGLRIFPIYCTIFYVFGIIGMEFLSYNQCGVTD